MTPRLSAEQKEALTEQRRAEIIDGAMRRWLEEGFDATTVDSIAREAGVAKGTVYLYFKTKQEILDAAVSHHSLLPDMRQHLAVLAGLPISAEGAIRMLVQGLWQRAKERVGIIPFFVREVPVRPEQARRFLEDVVLPANRLCADFFHPQIESGALREVDIFIASRALVGMLLVFLFTQEVFGGKEIHPLSDEQICGTVADVFLHGVLPRGKEG